jgi:hypothetical protein
VVVVTLFTVAGAGGGAGPKEISLSAGEAENIFNSLFRYIIYTLYDRCVLYNCLFPVHFCKDIHARLKAI